MPWLVLLLLASVGLLAALRKGPGGSLSGSSADVDALARVVLAEAGDRPPGDQEWTAVAMVAINRSRRWHLPLTAIVYSGPGAPTWNRSAQFYRFMAQAPLQRSWPAAQVFAARLLADPDETIVGSRISFVYPEHLAAFPQWSISRSRGGLAEQEPITVGRMLVT